MKKSKVLTIILVVLLVALGAGTIWIISENTGLTYAHADRYTAGEAALTEKVENLDVDWTSGDIRIEYHTGSEIRVTESGNREITGDDQVRWWLDGATLRIRYAKSGRFRLFDTLKKTLTLSLPEGTVLKTAEIHTTSGDMDIPGLNADEAKLSVTSGNVKAVADVRTLEVGATSGDLDIRAAGATDSVTIKVTSGRITAAMDHAKRVSAKSTSGGITVTGRVGEAEISVTSGTIDVKLDAFRKLNIEATSGNVKAALPENDGGFTCTASMTSGNFDYSGFERSSKDGGTYTFGDGKNECTIRTTSGDIRIVKAD